MAKSPKKKRAVAPVKVAGKDKSEPKKKITKKVKKLATVQTTPSTVSSKSTTDSKYVVTLMSGLALKSPSSLKKSNAVNVEETSPVDTVDYQDPVKIVCLKKEGIAAALEYHFPDDEEYLELDYHVQVMQLLTKLKPANLCSVLQGLLTDAGKNWRKLKLNKLKIMKVLAPEIAKACVKLFNANAELDISRSVPGDITIYHGDGQKKVTS